MPQPRRLTLDRWIDPETAHNALLALQSTEASHDGGLFWLDSGVNATEGSSFVGSGRTVVTASVDTGAVTITEAGESTSLENTTIFDYLRQASPHTRVGWFGYELGAQTVGAPWHPSRFPDAAFIEVDRMLHFDHRAHTVTAFDWSSSVDGASFLWLEDLLVEEPPGGRDHAAAEGSSAETPDLETAADGPASDARWRHGPTEYLRLVEECQDVIRRGDAYQLCLTNEVQLDGDFDAVDVYSRLRRQSPSHHGGIIHVQGISLLSASPETFLTITTDGTVTTKPIKGTRPRGATIESDAQLRSELLASEKERAENLMIVDLMRNDLARVSITGSVRVEHLFAVESYAQVHQLVSTVVGDMRPDIGVIDVIQACFPAGSMTGAPKISAIATLDALERGPRGVYAGAFGILHHNGAVDLAMVIRSIVLDERGASIGSGGGITALSVPEEELDETRVKISALVKVLRASQRAAIR